jgi:NADH-quinone oxidoreductase subunit M
VNLFDIVLLLPLIGFLITILIPKGNDGVVRMFTLAVSIAVFALSTILLGPTLERPAVMTWVTDSAWISTPQIRYHVGLDGVSIWLVLLSTLLTPISILLSFKYIQHRVKEFYAFLLLLEFGLIGVFAALDFFLFYVFWEVCLVPMYFLIGIWGHERRIYAAVKFFIYTMAGSVLMLAAILYLYAKTAAAGAATFDYPAMLAMFESGKLALTHTEELLLFLAFFLAFAIKVPLFPLHTWLPDAHVEAPTAGSVMLAAVMLKMGTYGLLRFCLPLFPNASKENAPWIVTLAIIGIIYGALVALVQPNMKKLVAYSSVSHLGFVVLGLFSGQQWGLDGAVYQMLNHGISTGALFMLVGFLYERQHSLEIKDYGGVSQVAPALATVFLITTLASIGMPALNNFVGEYLVLQAAAKVNIWWAVFAATGVILSACYMLWMYQRAFYGEASESVRHHVHDMKAREWICALPLLALMVWMGVYTQSFLPSIGASNKAVLDRIQPAKVEQRVAAPAAEVAQHGR